MYIYIPNKNNVFLVFSRNYKYNSNFKLIITTVGFVIFYFKTMSDFRF